MSKKAKIYDIRKHEYPVFRGSTFRTLQVAQCWVCGVKSNNAQINGWPGLGLRYCCPYSGECWHHELEKNKDHKKPDIKDDVKGEVDLKQIRNMTNVRGYKSGSGCTHSM